MDIKRALRNAVSTGKVFIGSSQTKKSVGKGQACPASFNTLQQSNKDHILRPRIFGLVGLSGMIEDVRTTEDVFASFGIDEIIQY